MKTLAQFKYKLAVRATAVYMDRADDLELTYKEYEMFFGSLGHTLLEIRLIESFGELVSKIENNEFTQIGVFASDLESFLFEK